MRLICRLGEGVSEREMIKRRGHLMQQGWEGRKNYFLPSRVRSRGSRVGVASRKLKGWSQPPLPQVCHSWKEDQLREEIKGGRLGARKTLCSTRCSARLESTNEHE